jgi:hypothetical protein
MWPLIDPRNANIYEEVVLSRKIENINVTLRSRTGRFIIIDICEAKGQKGSTN